MFKNLNKSLFVFLLLGLCCVSNTFAISLGSALDTMMTKLESDGTLRDIPGQSIVNSVYDKAMKTAQEQTFSPYSNALSQTVSYFRTYKNSQTNETSPICNTITQQDVSVVLYTTNTVFKNALVDIFEQEGKELIIPITKDYNQVTVCKKISACMGLSFDTTSNAAYIADQQHCEEAIGQVFQRASNVVLFYNTLSQDTYGTEFYQNGTLDDSDFDLLVDIAEIGRIMFAGYKPPLTTVFYGMPSVGSLFGGLGGLGGGGLHTSQDDSSNSINQQPSPSPSPSTDMGITNPSDNSLTPQTESPLGISFADVYTTYFDTPGQSPDVVLSTTSTDIDTFINQTNGGAAVNGNLDTSTSSSDLNLNFLGSNVCVAPYVLSGPTMISSGITISTTGLVTGNISSDVLFATPVPSDVYDAINKDYYTTISPNLLIDAVGGLIPLALSGVDHPTQQQVENAISDAVTTAFDLEASPDNSATQSCLSQCSSLPFLDMLVCQSNCLCSKFESPALGNTTTDNVGVSIPKGAFAVRFCRVPAIAAQMNKNKRVYSIEEIFTEIRNIFTTMRQSGQLFKTVKTKEFLDSGMKKNKFGDLFAFSIRIGTKPSYDNTPVSVSKNKLADTNAAMQKKLLRKGGDPISPAERNKYVVTADIAYQKALAQGITNTTTLQKLIDKERHTLSLSLNTIEQTTAFDAMRDKLMNASTINTQVASFLDSNLQFWIFTYQKLLDINALAASLEKKIEKGK